MSGGSGSRLWPLSTAARPKQFHGLTSERSLIQETALRVRGGQDVHFLPPLVFCSTRHKELIAQQLEAVGISPLAVICEPVGRSTAAVAVIASQLAAKMQPGAAVLLLPSDHLVSDPEAFRAAVARAAAAAEDHLVTFGIEPSGPETGFGYIQRKGELGEGVFEVARFAEKPDLATAQAYVDAGYLWNAGIFLFRPETLLDEMRRFRPDILDAAQAALAGSPVRAGAIELDETLFSACPAESLDVAVMEKTGMAAVAPCNIGWADVGSWSELWRLGERDAEGNLSTEGTLLLDTSGSVVWADGRTVATLGVRDLIIVATPDAVLVAHKSRAQEVKRIVDELAAKASRQEKT